MSKHEVLTDSPLNYLTCALTGWRYTVSDTQPPPHIIAVHPAVAHGTSWKLGTRPTRSDLILAFGGCLYSLYNVGLYIPQQPLNPHNFTNNWLLDSLQVVRDAVKHCEEVGTICRKRYPQLVGNNNTTSYNIQSWLDAIWELRATYEPAYNHSAALEKEADSITKRIMDVLARRPNDEQAQRIAAYVEQCAEEIGYIAGSPAHKTFIGACVRPQFASMQLLQDTISLLWSHAPQETTDQQRLLRAICQRIDDCLATYMSKDVGTRAQVLNNMLEADAQIFERGLRASIQQASGKQSSKQGQDWKEVLNASRDNLKAQQFSSRFAMALAKVHSTAQKH